MDGLYKEGMEQIGKENLLRDLAFDQSGFFRLEYLSVDDEEMKLCTREGIKSNEIDIIAKYN